MISTIFLRMACCTHRCVEISPAVWRRWRAPLLVCIERIRLDPPYLDLGASFVELSYIHSSWP